MAEPFEITTDLISFYSEYSLVTMRYSFLIYKYIYLQMLTAHNGQLAPFVCAADVQLVTYVPPPSETNYSAAFLTGSQAACKAACNAFTDAVLEIARNPIQRA